MVQKLQRGLQRRQKELQHVQSMGSSRRGYKAPKGSGTSSPVKATNAAIKKSSSASSKAGARIDSNTWGYMGRYGGSYASARDVGTRQYQRSRMAESMKAKKAAAAKAKPTKAKTRTVAKKRTTKKRKKG